MESQPPQSRLDNKQQSTEQQHSNQRHERMFESAEELIRFDATQTAVPPAIANRLKDTLATKPPAPLSVWQRLFGRKK